MSGTQERAGAAGQPLLLTQIFGAAFLVSTAVYGVVAWLVARQPPPARLPEPWFAPVLMGLAAVAIGVAPLVERLILSRPSERPASTWVVGVLIGFALREMGALHGLIASLATRDPRWFGAAGAAAIAAILLAWPRRARFDDYMARQAAGSSGP